MVDEIDPTQKSINTQVSLPSISRNGNVKNGANEPTPPIESSNHVKKDDNSLSEVAQTANKFPINYSYTKFQIKYDERGLKEVTYESTKDAPKWLVREVISKYQKSEKEPRPESQTIIGEIKADGKGRRGWVAW